MKRKHTSILDIKERKLLWNQIPSINKIQARFMFLKVYIL